MADGILIGGSPSTGSSVLVNLMNRRKDLLAGPETYLFMHPGLYADWKTNRRYLLRTRKWGGMKSIGWFAFNGADLQHSFYSRTKADLKDLVAGSEDLKGFADAFFGLAMRKKGAVQWVEKSPSNAISFDYFLRYFPEGRVIHTTRDPYDTVASLVDRGLSEYDAAAFYLVNTAFGLKPEGEGRYFRLRYEDWVNSPAEYLGRCFGFLGMEWDASILEPEKEENLKMQGWLQSERGRLGTGSIGRFDRLENQAKERIRFAVSRIRIKDAYRKDHRLPVSSISEICRILDYPFQEPEQLRASWLFYQKGAHQLKRMCRIYPFAGRNYPVTI